MPADRTRRTTMAAPRPNSGPPPPRRGSRPGRRPFPRIRVPATPSWWAPAATTGAVLVIAGVTGLWATGDGLKQMLTGRLLDPLGQLTGLLSAALILIQIVLMARVPLLERSFGQTELIYLHRTAGIASIVLLGLHVVLIVVAQTGVNLVAAVTGFVTLVTTTATMPMAAIATAMIAVVAATSLPPLRQKLSYEAWHLVHLYGYLGAGLAVPHVLVLGGDFEGSPAARIVWVAAWVAAMGTVVVWRVAVPIRRSLRHGFVVDRVVRESGDVFSVDVKGRDVHHLPVRAGQFFTVRFLSGPGGWRGHPYSLSAAPRRDGLRFTIKGLGDDSKKVGAVRPGTRVLLEGPYGRLTSEVRTKRRLVFMASGIGITPLRALVEDLPFAPGDATFLYRASSPDDLVFRGELERLAEARGVQLVYLVGRRLRGRSSWLPASVRSREDSKVLLELVPDIATRDVYVCGADGWLQAALLACDRAGVPATQVHWERFGW